MLHRKPRDTRYGLLASRFLFRIGRCYCPLRGLNCALPCFMSLALSCEGRYDCTIALLFFDLPYGTLNLHFQSHCIHMPIHP